MYRFNCFILLASVVLILFSSCATNNLTLGVTEPAPVALRPDVYRVGVINRTAPDEKNAGLDKVDKILSMEGKNLDKEAADEALSGLFTELKNNSRFDEVKIIELEQKSAGLGIFPAPLSWAEVQAICEENGVDVLFTLEMFDTDANVAYQTAPVTINGPLGAKIPAIEHNVMVTTMLKTGWRIYDPALELILDEFVINDTQVSTGRGINPAKAAEAVTGRKQAVLRISSLIGSSYSARVMPYNIRVSREYFVKGTDNFKVAKRRAQTGNWDGAAELWNKEVENSKRKVAGRACYNMAIINEINGDLGTAIDWASRSYTDYKNRTALDYLDILRYRVARQQELQNQAPQ